MAAEDRDSLVEQWQRKLKNIPAVAVVVIALTVVTGIAALTDSVEKIRKFLDKPIPPKPVEVIPPRPQYDLEQVSRELKEVESESLRSHNDVLRWQEYIEKQKAQIATIKASRPTTDDEARRAVSNISYCETLIREGTEHLENAKNKLHLSEERVSVLRARIAQRP